MISRLRTWWSGLARRERGLVVAAVALAAAIALYAIAIEPAWRVRARSSMEIPRLQEQLVVLETLREEVRLLRQKGFGTQSVEALKTAAEQSLSRDGIVAVVRLQGDRIVEVTAKAVPAAVWFNWIEQFGRDARTRIVHARVARAESLGMVGAEAAFEIPPR